jgi:hypothetical protein
MSARHSAAIAGTAYACTCADGYDGTNDRGGGCLLVWCCSETVAAGFGDA